MLSNFLMKLKLLPPLVMVIFGVFMYLLNRFLPVGDFDFFGREGLMYFIGALAFIIALIALAQFFRKSTTINPHKPENTSDLVTSGIYNYTRNPMYLALLLVLIAIGLYLQNAFNTIIIAGFVFYMNHFQIIPEEKILEKKFGKEYRLYLKAVRRWF